MNRNELTAKARYQVAGVLTRNLKPFSEAERGFKTTKTVNRLLEKKENYNYLIRFVQEEWNICLKIFSTLIAEP
jgi:hypothetical protein